MCEVGLRTSMINLIIMSRFEIGETYHIYNRGVDKRNIFLDKSDYRRFLFILDIFNDTNSTTNTLRRVNLSEGLKNSQKPEPKIPLVEIEEFCLMPNHFHLLLKQIIDNGISKFMQKIGVGHTHYFNQKYDRSGVLFQGKTKSKHINTEAFYLWIKRYIHLNPLDLMTSSKIKVNNNTESLIRKLDDYRWVSCSDYSIYRSDLNKNLDEILEEVQTNFVN
jgi:putative transposase